MAGMKQTRLGLVPFLAIALGACDTYVAKYIEPKIEENILPRDYKPAILTQLRTMVDDPTNIRDAYISEPTLKATAGATRYIVCMRFNAKDRNGQYAGNREVAAYYFAGSLTQIVDASRELCGGVNYQPFPELQRLCRTLTCPS
jgi:hypothetical protein